MIFTARSLQAKVLAPGHHFSYLMFRGISEIPDHNHGVLNAAAMTRQGWTPLL